MKSKFKRVLSLVIVAVLLASVIPFSVNAATNNTYTVTLNQNEKIKYSGVSKTAFEIKSTAYKSVYAKVINDYQEQYYIDDINITPDKSADITFYRNTGEIFIENVKSDFSITPVVKAKTVADSLSVKWDFVNNGVYSEENPAATVKFTAELKDSDGNAVANTKVYYKSDKTEKSFTNVGVTDKDGKVSFKHAYALNEGEDEADYTALFSTDSKFADSSVNASSDLKVVQQKKSDLYLTTDQVKDSLANTKTGGVINLNPKYEYFTGVLHQGAINTASGEWVTPENETITGLAPGQYGIRFREYVDGNTIYLHSDYDYFTIGRAIWTVTANNAASENVTFSDAKLYATPGGDVFYYFDVKDGYEVTDYSVNKPAYISEISYNKEDGYVKISGVTGNINLTVKAEEISGNKIVAQTSFNTVKSVKLNALSEEDYFEANLEPSVEILDVYQDLDATDEGTQIAFKIKVNDESGNPANVTSSNLKLYYKQSTSKNYSTASTRNFTNGDETGVATIWFKVSGSTSAEKTYYTYADYSGTQSQLITINIEKTPSITARSNLSITNEKGNRSNGTITVIGTDYDRFLYHKQGQETKQTVDGTVITGLDKGTWYVYVASDFQKVDDSTYEIRLRSSSATASVGQDEDDTTYYTVKFVDINGKTVSKAEYEEGTKASYVKIPENTKEYTEGNKVYSYSWPEVSAVTADVTYKEIETVVEKQTANVKILNVYPNNNEGTYLSFELSVTDNDGNTVSANDGITVYIDGNKTRGSVTANNDGTITFNGTSSIKTGNHTAYAEFENETYATSKSDSVTINLSKASKPELEQYADINSSKQGKIIITSYYKKFNYYRQGENEATTEEKIIAGLLGSSEASVSSDYYVYAVPQAVEGDADYNFVTASDKATIKVENIDLSESSVGVKLRSSKSFTENSRDYVRFDFARLISKNYTLVSHGILYGTSASVFGNGNADEALKFADDNGNELKNKVKNYVVNNTLTSGTDYIEVYIGSNRDGVVYSRGYVIAKNIKTGETEIFYSDVANGSYNSLSDNGGN